MCRAKGVRGPSLDTHTSKRKSPPGPVGGAGVMPKIGSPAQSDFASQSNSRAKPFCQFCVIVTT